MRWQRAALAIGTAALLLYFLFGQVFLSGVIGHDGFWHLLTGGLIDQAGSVPRADPLCFTTEGFDWVNLNWLAQWIGYRLFRWLGFAGPFALSSCLFVLGLVCTWANLRERKAAALPGVVAIGFVFWALWAPHGVRPRVWTFALLALVALLLTRERLGGPRALALVLVLALWNNLHGGFVYGYGLIGFWLVGAGLDAWRAEERVVTRSALLVSGALLVGLLLFALHPHGFSALHHALTYPLRFKAEYFAYTQELQPFDFSGPLGPALEAYLLLAATGVLLAPRRIRWADLLPLLVFLHLALTVRRGVTPLVVISAPFVAEQWTHVLRERASVLERLEERLRPAFDVLPAVLALALLVWCVGFAPRRTPPGEIGQLDARVLVAEERDLPVGVARYLREQRPAGRIFNQFGAGGILAWALFPEQHRIFIDGRGDLHSRGDALDVYLAVTTLQPGWKEHLDRLRVALVVMPERAPLVHALETSHGWRRVHRDAAFVLLRRP